MKAGVILLALLLGFVLGWTLTTVQETPAGHALRGVTDPVTGPRDVPAIAPMQDASAQAPGIAPAPKSAAATEGIEIVYETRGSAMIVPVTFEGPNGRELTLDMMFDTGATYTTLTRDHLAQLGVTVPKDAPVLRSTTANGPREDQVVQLDRVWIGDTPIEPVTIYLCPDCKTSKVAGLLGMNVSGRYLITIDTVGHLLSLEPRDDPGGLTQDLRPWLRLGCTMHRRGALSRELECTATNLAARPMASVTVMASCNLDMELTIRNVPAGGQASARVKVPRETECGRRFTTEVLSASW